MAAKAEKSAARSRKAQPAKNAKNVKKTAHPHKRGASPVATEVQYLAIAAIGILLMLSMYVKGAAGFVGRFIEQFCVGLLGFGAYVIPLAVIGVSLYMLFSGAKCIPRSAVIKSLLLLWLLISLLHVVSTKETTVNQNLLDYFEGMFTEGGAKNGGLMGALLGTLLLSLLGKAGTYLLLLAGLLIVVVSLTGRSFANAVSATFGRARHYLEESAYFETDDEDYEEPAQPPVSKPRTLKPLPDRPAKKKKEKQENSTLVIAKQEERERKRVLLVHEDLAQSTPEYPVFPPRKQKTGKGLFRSEPEGEVVNLPNITVKGLVDAPETDTYLANANSLDGSTSEEPDQTPPVLSRAVPKKSPSKAAFLSEPDSAFESDSPFEPDSDFESKSLFEQGSAFESDSFFEQDSVFEPDSFFESDSAFGSNSAFESDSAFESSSAFEPDALNESVSPFEAEEALFNDDPPESFHEQVEPVPTQRTVMSFPGKSGTTKPAGQLGRPMPKPSSQAVEPAPLSQMPRYENYQLPPVTLLTKNQSLNTTGSRTQILENSRILEETLKSFRVEAKVIEVSVGPTVTRYDLSPGPGVKVSAIANLSNDLALSLAAQGIRIEAPIPGKAAVGIEIPNKDPQPVLLREIIEDEAFQRFPSKLGFAVGKDIAGSAIITDVARMPHLLIAGATGSGKSVCINTLITSLLYKARPDEVKLLMIDPKVVELSVYNGIPHLLIPVVTDPKKASGALSWAVTEMDNRYGLFAETGVRDLKSYNAYKTEEDEDAPIVPQIVIIIDELADLMMVCKGEVEESICRLAQKARAAGIHLVVATQRPSVDVITGLIKANIPSRLAFAVSSGTDSRTVLDVYGAEKLLGKGDMLFLPMGQSKPIRLQCGYISDKEVENVVTFLKEQTVTVYPPEMIEQVTSANRPNGGDEELDEFFTDAVEFLLEKGKASTSMLQRQFRIGYNRASRLMEDLETRGIVGPEDGVKPRKIMITWEEYENMWR